MKTPARVLVIEDDPFMRRMLQTVLAPEGHDCTLAASAAQGKAYCAERRPDVILLDIHLPDGYGIDLCRAFKSDPGLKGVGVILITGVAREEAKRLEGLEAGADAYLLKPFGAKDLLLSLNSILKKAAAP